MDTHRSPEDILSEILNRDASASPSPAAQPPKFDLPSPEDAPTSAPEKKPDRDWADLLLPWLCMVLAAALLVMGVCVLQVVRMNTRLDELQQAVESVQAVDRLQGELDQLKQENEGLRAVMQAASEAQTEMARDVENFQEGRDSAIQQLNIAVIQRWRSDYLFYIGQFMENGDYPMAALAAALSANRYFSTDANLGVPPNPAQLEQYQAYRRELLDRGYLQELTPETFPIGGTNSEFAEQYDPRKDPDMAALGILWCALDRHFVQENDNAATQHLTSTPLGDPDSGYQERLERQASEFTLKQFQFLKDDLVENGWLCVADDGTLSMGNITHTMEGYSLPFDLPE